MNCNAWNCRVGLFSAFCCLLFFVFPAKEAWADTQWPFYQNSGFSVNPDSQSGFAFGLAQGEEVVPVSINSNISYIVGDPGEITLYASMTVGGVWGDPSSYGDPYYGWLEEYGLHSFNSFSLTEFEWNGDQYQFNNLVYLNQQGSANISFNSDHTGLVGFFTSVVEGQGAVPLRAWSTVQIYQPGHPFEIDWQVTFGSEWLVTSQYQLVPAPATLTLLALGGLVSARRRREVKEPAN